MQLPPAPPRPARLRRAGADGRRPRAPLAQHACTRVDFDAGAERDEEFQAASSLARAALLELSDTTCATTSRPSTALTRLARGCRVPADGGRRLTGGARRDHAAHPGRARRVRAERTRTEASRCTRRPRQRARGAEAVIPPLLRENLNFRRFFIGQSVSLLGDQVTALALPLTAVLALDATRGPDGRADDAVPDPEPDLLAARGCLGRPARAAGGW